MTNRSNDDIANALKGLASGEHVEPEGAGDDVAHPSSHVPHPAPPAAAPANPAPQPRPAPAVPLRPTPQPLPASPGRPGRPSQPGGAAAPQRAATPTAPGTAGARAASPVVGGVTPGAGRSASPGPVPAARVVQNTAVARPPAAATPAAPDFAVADAPAPESEGEDDAASMPAPGVEYLAARHHHPAPTAPRPALAKSLAFRRTVIPVLLTTGVLMLVTAVMKYVVHPDAPLAALPTWLVVVLAVASVALVMVAVLNMVQVQNQSAATGPDAPANSQ